MRKTVAGFIAPLLVSVGAVFVVGLVITFFAVRENSYASKETEVKPRRGRAPALPERG